VIRNQSFFPPLFLFAIYWHTAQPSNYKTLPFEGEVIKGIFNTVLTAGLWSDEREREHSFCFNPGVNEIYRDISRGDELSSVKNKCTELTGNNISSQGIKCELFSFAQALK